VSNNVELVKFVKPVRSLKTNDKILKNYLSQFIEPEQETPSLVLTQHSSAYNLEVDRMLKSKNQVGYCIRMKLQE